MKYTISSKTLHKGKIKRWGRARLRLVPPIIIWLSTYKPVSRRVQKVWLDITEPVLYILLLWDKRPNYSWGYPLKILLTSASRILELQIVSSLWATKWKEMLKAGSKELFVSLFRSKESVASCLECRDEIKPRSYPWYLVQGLLWWNPVLNKVTWPLPAGQYPLQLCLG